MSDFKTGRTNKLLFPAENPTSAVNKDAVCFFVPSGKHCFSDFKKRMVETPGRVAKKLALNIKEAKNGYRKRKENQNQAQGLRS